MRLPLSATLTVAICLLAAPARAEIITLLFTGKITSFMGNTPISEVFSVGDGFEIYYSYSNEALLNVFDGPDFKEYWGRIGDHELARSQHFRPMYTSTGLNHWEDDRCYTCGSLIDPPEYQPLTLSDGTQWRLAWLDAYIRNGGNPLTVTPETTADFNVFFQNSNPVPYHYYPGFRMAASQIRQVPEPGTLALLGAGLLGLAAATRRRRHSK